MGFTGAVSPYLKGPTKAIAQVLLNHLTNHQGFPKYLSSPKLNIAFLNTFMGRWKVKVTCFKLTLQCTDTCKDRIIILQFSI